LLAVLGQRAGDGGMSKTAMATLQACTFDGVPREVRQVREFVGRLVDGCPVADEVILLSDELAANAVLHTASGDNGTFSVYVLLESAWVRVEIHDLGSASAPTIRRSAQPAESGRGLGIVETVADRWGFHDGQRGRVVWFEMDWQ
jgi:anti-sigma regulatory factor (Ser/Thr protein kinase)